MDGPEFQNIEASGSVAHVAAFHGRDDVLAFLSQHFPSSLTARTDTGATPAHVAAACGNCMILQTLVDLGGPDLLTATDDDGWTPAHTAAYYSRLSALQLLADILGPHVLQVRDSSGLLPEDLAQCERTRILIRKLVKRCGIPEETQQHAQTDQVQSNQARTCREDLQRRMSKKIGPPHGISAKGTSSNNEQIGYGRPADMGVFENPKHIFSSEMPAPVGGTLVDEPHMPMYLPSAHVHDTISCSANPQEAGPQHHQDGDIPSQQITHDEHPSYFAHEHNNTQPCTVTGSEKADIDAEDLAQYASSAVTRQNVDVEAVLLCANYQGEISAQHDVEANSSGIQTLDHDCHGGNGDGHTNVGHDYEVGHDNEKGMQGQLGCDYEVGLDSEEGMQGNLGHDRKSDYDLEGGMQRNLGHDHKSYNDLEEEGNVGHDHTSYYDLEGSMQGNLGHDHKLNYDLEEGMQGNVGYDHESDYDLEGSMQGKLSHDHKVDGDYQGGMQGEICHDHNVDDDFEEAMQGNLGHDHKVDGDYQGTIQRKLDHGYEIIHDHDEQAMQENLNLGQLRGTGVEQRCAQVGGDIKCLNTHIGLGMRLKGHDSATMSAGFVQEIGTRHQQAAVTCPQEASTRAGVKHEETWMNEQEELSDTSQSNEPTCHKYKAAEQCVKQVATRDEMLTMLNAMSVSALEGHQVWHASARGKDDEADAQEDNTLEEIVLHKASTQSQAHLEQEKDAWNAACSNSSQGWLQDVTTKQQEKSWQTLLGSLRSGTDITSMLIPAEFIRPESALERIQDTMQHGKTLELVAASTHADPVTRLLAVVRFHISGIIRAVFDGKKPYNPILGETCAWAFDHGRDGGITRMVCEQVSHHPPISAIHLENTALGISMHGYAETSPTFTGNSVDVPFKGERRLKIWGLGEEYVMTVPNLQYRGLFLGARGAEWVGKISVRCDKTNMLCKLHFKPLGWFGMWGGWHQVTGEVVRAKSTVGKKSQLCTLSGHWDRGLYVVFPDLRKELLYDFDTSAVRHKPAFLHTPKAILQTDSTVVWATVSQALKKKDMAAANREKTKVEQLQRNKAKEHMSNWQPIFYKKAADGRGWEPKEDVIRRFHEVNMQAILK